MTPDDSIRKAAIPLIIKHNIRELLDSVTHIENELHDIREVIWTLEDKLREEGLNVAEGKV